MRWGIGIIVFFMGLDAASASVPTIDELQGVWLRVSTSCGPYESSEALQKLRYRASENMPVGAFFSFIGNRFSVSVVRSALCGTELPPDQKFTDLQDVKCSHAATITGTFEYFRSDLEPDRDAALYLNQDPAFIGANIDNEWGRQIITPSVEKVDSLLIMKSSATAGACPPGQQWWTYWIPYPET